MRAGRSAWCGIVLGMVAMTGCAPFFGGESGPTAPESGAPLYRGPPRAAAAEGMYGAFAPASPAAEEVSSAITESRAPVVIALPAPEGCPGPVVIKVACADGSGASRELLYEQEAPPPAPYKPWPHDGPHAPRLYHDR